LRLFPSTAVPAVTTAVNACNLVCLLLALFCLDAVRLANAQSPALGGRASPEPITPIPATHAQDSQRVLLGERLFSDRRLSHNNTHSCSSCHDIATNGASANVHDTRGGQPIALNTPTVFNVSLNFRLNWEGSFRSLEEGIEQSLRNPAIMASSVDEAVGKLRAVLIELDPTANEAERDHLRNDLLAERLNIARLRAALSGSDDPAADFTPPADADPELIRTQRQLLLNQVTEHRAKIAALARQQAQKEAEQATTEATIHKLETILPVIQSRVDIRKTLVEKELGSKLSYFEVFQLLVEQQEELRVQKSHLMETAAAIAAIRETRAQAAAEYRHSISDDLAKAEQKANGLAQDLIKAEQKTRLQLLTAPVDGVVQQLAVHTVGGVVTPAQSLLVVVPSDSRLEIEAMVSNNDIGFVHAGQQAEIKVDTFNFTRYGLLHGEVLSVSRDAVIRDRPQDRFGERTPGAANETSEPKGQELNYSARISLDRTQMQIDDRMVDLSPGMAVTVEIKTGSRNILSYLL
jgi:hemolysin D